MSDWTTLAGIEGVLALGIISPGPNFAVVSSAAMTVSRRTGVAPSIGVAFGSLIWAGLAVAVLGLLIGRVAWLSTAIGIAGAAYLIWLGGRMIWGARRPAPIAGEGAGDRGLLRAMGRGLVANMANPKAIAFYGSIFAVTVPVAAPIWMRGAILLLALVTSAGWYCTIALLFSRPAMRGALLRAKPRIDTVMGTVLMALGLRLLVRSAA